MNCIKNYHKSLDKISKGIDDSENFEMLSQEMERLDAWNIESNIKSILSELGILDESLKMIV